MSGSWQLSTKDNGRCSHNMMDWLKLGINTVGCWISGLEVKRSRMGLKVLSLSPVCGIVDKP